MYIKIDRLQGLTCFIRSSVDHQQLLSLGTETAANVFAVKVSVNSFKCPPNDLAYMNTDYYKDKETQSPKTFKAKLA